MSDKATIPPKANMAKEHPKHVLMRAGRRRAVEGEKEPQAWARSPNAADNQKAPEKFKAVGKSAPPNAVLGTDWGQGDARHWLWDTEDGKQSYAYNGEQLLRAAAFCAAEFQVSRRFY